MFIISQIRSGDNRPPDKKTVFERKIRIPWYSLLFWLFLIFRAPTAGTFLTLGSALIHEGGHLAAAFLTGVPVERITVYPFGADIRFGPGLRSYRDDIVTVSAGAAANLLLAGIGLLIGGAPGRFLTVGNLLLAGLNLMPIEGLDGGTLLTTVLTLAGRGDAAPVAIRISSFFCLFGLWLAAVYILLIRDGDPSLFVLACGLFSSIFLRRKKAEGYRGKSSKSEDTGVFQTKIGKNHE